MNHVTVATLGLGRPAHLANMMRGLAQQTQPPCELVVAVMGGTRYDDLPDVPFPVQMIEVREAGLRLSAARNAAVATARGDVLAFLDIDCIPSPSFCADYAAAADGFDGLMMGEVMYLPQHASAPGWSFAAFDAVAVKHSDRRGPPASGLELCEDYRCFWSLNFAVSRLCFERLGGFDERYVGYGGEDTDFAKAASVDGTPLAWLKGGLAYHQYHPHHMPPLHHLASVVRNAELFERKWGYRTMGHWLHAFRLMGLIDDRGPKIRILREPNEADLALTFQQSHMPYANTAEVVRQLMARQMLAT